jgi:hypothetical protein
VIAGAAAALLAALVAVERRAALGPPATGWTDILDLAAHHRLASPGDLDALEAAVPVLERQGLAEVEWVPHDTRRGPEGLAVMHVTPAGLAAAQGNGHALAIVRPADEDEVRWLCTCGVEGAVHRTGDREDLTIAAVGGWRLHLAARP